MQRGNWVPINKKLVSSLPKSGERPYTELEAAFCLTCDFDNESLVSENGYSKLWSWSRGKVSRFAKKQGWKVSKEAKRGLNQILIDRNAKGRVIHDPTWTKRTTDDTTGEQLANNWRTTGEQPRPLGNSDLGGTANNQRATDEQPTIQPTNNQRYTTSYPDPEPDPDPKNTTAPKGAGQSDEDQQASCPASSFEKVWAAYPRKQGKKAALKVWKRDKLEKIAGQILSSLELQKKSVAWTKDGGQFIPAGSTWFNGARWEDELEESHVSTPAPNGKKFDKEKYLNGGMNPMLGDKTEDME